MVRFLTPGATRCAAFRSAKIFRSRKLISGVIKNLIGAYFWRCVGPQTVDLPRDYDDHEDEEELEQERRCHASIGHERVGSFPGQPRSGPRKGRTDAGDEAFPARRPLDQQLRRVLKLNNPDLFELESLAHARFFVLALFVMPGGNSVS